MAHSWNRKQGMPRQHDALGAKKSKSRGTVAPTIEVDNTRSCGECLADLIEVVHLDAHGVCPKCGADYGEAL